MAQINGIFTDLTTYNHTLIELIGYSREGILILFLLDNQCAGTQGHLHLA